MRVEWLGQPITTTAPLLKASEVVTSVRRPRAYWIPAAWQEVIERLQLHGIPMERISSPREVDVRMYRLSDPKYVTPQFEGHVRVTAATTEERRRETFPVNSVRISTDR